MHRSRIRNISSPNIRKVSKLNPSDYIFHFFNYFLLLVLGMAFLYPIVYQIAISFSNPIAVMTNQVVIWPVNPTLEAYREVIKSDSILTAYRNTIYYTVMGTLFQLIGTTMLAYPLSKKRLRGRRMFSLFFYFTNIFNGGLIPTYLVVKGLGMLDSVWALVIPGAISVYYGIILRTSFESIPSDLEDAAQIDGLSNWGILGRIYVPLSKATYATLVMFFAVGFWNSYIQPLIYMQSSDKFTLQMVLRNIVLAGTMTDISSSAVGMSAHEDMRTNPETLKAASIMFVMLPVMCIYPFVQRYFVGGIMIGAVKG